jgi:hypothetical protein
MILFALRMAMLAWFVALIMFALSIPAGWDTSCAEFPHCDFVMRPAERGEYLNYYLAVMVPS